MGRVLHPSRSPSQSRGLYDYLPVPGDMTKRRHGGNGRFIATALADPEPDRTLGDMGKPCGDLSTPSLGQRFA